ncbi:uncharacterized protein LOC119669386 [Teleopsis dalmanni]|uniref:uncharacterized protein LOC119669386 n=1 Tax=Teleopsis dalmanni TaxID=139649 RepID=UPI0018CEBB55|nr:uncharacterized protein LOC119669386 [Teleopsis dalmanni]
MRANFGVLHRIVHRAFSQTGGEIKSTTKASNAASSPTSINTNVKGLSSNCVEPTSTPVGPGAAPNAPYKVMEYFCFNRFSYAEAEVEMAKFRCPQPSAIKK